jgi:hypothetical protein
LSFRTVRNVFGVRMIDALFTKEVYIESNVS